MSQGTPRFTHVNEGFQCRHCSKSVPPATSTCRDHCPFCLHSLHVDIFPGDRAAQCEGLLAPQSYYLHKKKGPMIEYRCVKCGEKRVNRFLERDQQVADDYESLLALTRKSGES